MQRPLLEVADLVRAAGERFVEKSRGWLSGQHLKVLSAIEHCRTAALGGHLDECSNCGYRPAISYNSCRDRHCPKCQANTRERWLQARRKQLLPTRYLHAVFTLEANAALRSIVRRDSGESYEGFLKGLAAESGIETPSCEQLAKLDKSANTKGPTRIGRIRMTPMRRSHK